MTNIVGYTDYEFDVIVKFGGSLLIDSTATQEAIKALIACQQKGFNILVLPGGGPTDKTIEAVDKLRPLAAQTHHQACALAQDQTGLIICDPRFSSVLRAVRTLADARKASKGGYIPVLLPSQLIFVADPFEPTWEITSDGMAVWLAWLTNTPITAILTNVEGIFPPWDPDFLNSCLESVDAITLLEWGATSVDKCVPAFQLARGGKVWVGSGKNHTNLLLALMGQPGSGTWIR